jgi:hypothetical protein
MVAEGNTFRTNLAKTPLPEIIATINQFKVSGMLEVTHQGVEKKVFFEDEFVTFASSNVNDDRLGEFLIRIGKIKQIDYDNSVDILKKTRKRQGQIFVELGCLTPKDLFWAVKSQVKEIVLSLFLWTDGEVNFVPGDFVQKETIKLRAPITETIVEGIKRIQNPRRLIGYIGGKDIVIKVASDALDKMEKTGLGPEYFDIYNLIDGKKPLEEIANTSDKGASETVRSIYTMMVLNILERA